MHDEAQISPEKDNSLDFKKVMCRFCKSEDVFKKGFRKTPAEKEGFDIDLGKNKWKKLIEIATYFKSHAQ
ncbi:hypothetical protein HYT51_02995 [Candidatus Woesearchaeota archaeon]|nr:hypothetical protein [Candidatus Woesearchaeota archaeon]